MVQPKTWQDIPWWQAIDPIWAFRASKQIPAMKAYSADRTKPTRKYIQGLTLEEYQKRLTTYLASLRDAGQATQDEIADLWDKAIAQAQAEGIHAELPYVNEIAAEVQLGKEGEGATEVLKGKLWQGTGGHWFNKQGDVVSDEVAQWMIAKAGRQPATGGKASELAGAPSSEALAMTQNAALTAQSRMGRQVWEQGQQGALAQLQQPLDWITKWMTQYARKPEFQVTKPWYGRTPEEREQYLSRNEFGPVSTGALRQGYSDVAAYKSAVDRAMALGAEQGDIGIVPQGPYPVAEGGATTIGGSYTSPNAPARRGPPVPGWITFYVPSLKGGVGLFKQKAGPMPTPTPYQLNQLNPSQQGMLQGYQQWYEGQSPDVLAKQQAKILGTKTDRYGRFPKTVPETWDDIMYRARSMLPTGGRGVRSYSPIRRR